MTSFLFEAMLQQLRMDWLVYEARSLPHTARAPARPVLPGPLPAAACLQPPSTPIPPPFFAVLPPWLPSRRGRQMHMCCAQLRGVHPWQYWEEATEAVTDDHRPYTSLRHVSGMRWPVGEFFSIKMGPYRGVHSSSAAPQQAIARWPTTLDSRQG